MKAARGIRKLAMIGDATLDMVACPPADLCICYGRFNKMTIATLFGLGLLVLADTLAPKTSVKQRTATTVRNLKGTTSRLSRQTAKSLKKR
ncbi:unnamed protein product, partial [Mesorhabditis spiculigera]